MKEFQPSTEVEPVNKTYILGDTITLRFVPEKHLFGKVFSYPPIEAVTSLFNASGEIIRNDMADIKDDVVSYEIPAESVNKVGEYSAYFDCKLDNGHIKIFHVNFEVVPRGVKKDVQTE
jgi:hypothetical protein